MVHRERSSGTIAQNAVSLSRLMIRTRYLHSAFITQPADYDWENPEAISVRACEASAAAVPVCSCARWRFLSLSEYPPLLQDRYKLCPSHSVSASSHSFPNFLPRPLLSLQWCVYLQTPSGAEWCLQRTRVRNCQLDVLWRCCNVSLQMWP